MVSKVRRPFRVGNMWEENLILYGPIVIYNSQSSQQCKMGEKCDNAADCHKRIIPHTFIRTSSSCFIIMLFASIGRSLAVQRSWMIIQMLTKTEIKHDSFILEPLPISIPCWIPEFSIDVLTSRNAVCQIGRNLQQIWNMAYQWYS